MSASWISHAVLWSAMRLRIAFERTSRGSAHVCRFCSGEIWRAVTFVCFAEQLADDVFHGHFLHIDVANITGVEKSPAGFRNLCAWNFQLHRDGCLFCDFAECRQVTCSFLFKSKTQNLIA